MTAYILIMEMEAKCLQRHYKKEKKNVLKNFGSCEVLFLKYILLTVVVFYFVVSKFSKLFVTLST